MNAENFAGYLLQVGIPSGTSYTYKTVPLKYINEKTYSSTPNQREEIKAYRDDNTRDLTRVTAKGKKSKVVFSTRPKLHLKDKIVLQQLFLDAETTDEAKQQRKIHLKFWNDEENVYKTGDFYMPDITFPIIKVIDNGLGNSDIIYDSLNLSFVEY